MPKTYTLKQAVDLINQRVLGVPTYGFESEQITSALQPHFTRSGEIDGDPYSSKVNTVLSQAAVSHTLTHIRSSLKTLVEEEG